MFSWGKWPTPCSKRDRITSSSMAEFSSIFDTKGAMRSCAYFFTVETEEFYDCRVFLFKYLTFIDQSRTDFTTVALNAVAQKSFHAHLHPSSYSPPLNMSEGEEKEPLHLSDLNPQQGEIWWTCSSIQSGMIPMIEGSVWGTESQQLKCHLKMRILFFKLGCYLDP